MTKFLENECAFQTERLKVVGYINYVTNQARQASLANQVLNIMSPKVTRALPAGWQNINTTLDANNWINKIIEECSFLLVQLKDTEEVIGFIFLYEPASMKQPVALRLGYLLSEKFWGNGIASELIKGLLTWCSSSGAISSITAGVEAENSGSIKVLMKNGFVATASNDERMLFYAYNFC
jgi:RimJ/RimL family protein N-acetyltransferase